MDVGLRLIAKMQKNLLKNIFEVFVGFQVVCLCGFSDTVQHRAGFGAILVVDHVPAMLADAEASNAALGIIVV